MIRKIKIIIEKVVGPAFAKATAGKEKFLVTASEKPEFGHYSTNAAFFSKEDPQKIANEILRQASAFAKASADKQNLFEKVEVRGKFINFWISRQALLEELRGLLQTKRGPRGKKEKINLEFVSANPTGPLTIANGRGGFLGDVLANVLEVVGYKVTREYYINDAGNQVRLLGESVLAALGKAEAKEEHYKGAYIKELAQSLKSKIKNQKSKLQFKNEKIESEEIGRLAAKELLKEIRDSLKNVGVKFDEWFSEYKNLRKKGEVEKILKILEQKNLVEKKEGAVWLKRPEGAFARPDSKNESDLGLKTSDIADEKDRVLVKSNGQPTYFLADLAYHYDKFVKRKFDQAIDIWGADHHGYVARLKAGIKALGIDPEKLKIIITQLVRLIEDGKEVRMSKRKGEFITLDELISEVGKDAARFFFLMHAPDTHMDFDLALAKEKSLKNPVYYVQYAYVRCSSILKKSKIKMQNEKLQFKIQNLQTESELNLIKELIKFPDVILQTAEDYQVSRLTRYATEVARAVHNFYEKERVIPADAEAMAGEGRKLMEARLALVSVTSEILARLFKVIGIDAPEKM